MLVVEASLFNATFASWSLVKAADETFFFKALILVADEAKNN